MPTIGESGHDHLSKRGAHDGRSAQDRHATAVANSVAMAHEAADHGDFAEALSWVSVLRAIDALPTELEQLCRRWLDCLAAAEMEAATR